MKQLIANQLYVQNFNITKIECKNRIIGNYNRRLKHIASKTTVSPVPVAVRRVLYPNYQLHLRVAHQRINELQKEFRSGPFHVVGDHGRCQERGYFCKGRKDGEVCLVEELKAVGMWDELMSSKNLVAHHASSLVHDVSTNSVERFNSERCKFVGGKRANFLHEVGTMQYAVSLLLNITLKAIPDDLIDSDLILEVKCPFIVAHKEDDRYMYQIQVQLHITQRKMCYFVIWTPLGMLVQKIVHDMEFWKTKMVQKLNNF
ncbi:hypothetical protein PR048_016122 [Dryococelus australis]|uniref:YqaJ viral recombinase domain-containing protein n=1 Tax=Dryococelus australis TaxID=614101 RepID=A0ABQ9HIU8_9NEOP|nr:hypothetical protein PR048_016122 [Dryococelus australis]